MSDSAGRGDRREREPRDPAHDRPDDAGTSVRPAGSEHAGAPDGIESLRDRLAGLERLLQPEGRALQQVERRVVPAWKRVTQGEPRWQVGLAIAAAIALQLELPDRLVLLRPAWLLPALEGLLFAGLIVANPRRIDRQSRAIRTVSLILAGVISLGNAWSAERLVVGLLRGAVADRAGPLLANGAAIWVTNVIAFALWYWEFDRGGPVARMNATRAHPDFLFAQMTSPELAPPEWEPMFGDYLYLSFTNATAFSPTDVLPLSRWAKMTMLVQSAVSLGTVALVIARAVNVLR
jgi:uncharacterized membrane protein